MASLNALSREQLVAMLHARDEELVSLRAINKQSTVRLADLERSLSAFADRLKAVEQLDADLRAVHLNLSRQQNDATRRIALAAEEKEQLLKQIDALGRQLEREIVDRRGCFATLGLKLSQKGDDEPVVVVDTRSPAKGSGVEIGDVLTAVRLSSSYSVETLADYNLVVADMTPESSVELSLSRRGKHISVLLRPAVVMH
jgi:predicted metalloprotease with PDZ domain